MKIEVRDLIGSTCNPDIISLDITIEAVLREDVLEVKEIKPDTYRAMLESGREIEVLTEATIYEMKITNAWEF